MTTFLVTLVAVLGTLSGSLLTGVLSARTARLGREAAQRDADRTVVVTALADLVAALNAHRAAMWLREDLRLRGEHEAYEQARERSHATRAAVSAPLAKVCVLAPWLAGVARGAAQATYDLRNADAKDLSDLRTDALTASDRLIRAASARLAVA